MDVWACRRLLAAAVEIRHRSKLRKLMSPRLVRIAFEARVRAALGRPRATRCRTFWGAEMSVVLPEPVSVGLALYGFHEADTSAALLRLLRPGEVFVDVGAHFGYFSLLASDLVGPDGTVVALEPTPGTYAVLEKNTSTRRNVTTRDVAAHSEPGRLEINDYGPAWSAWNSVTLPRTTGRGGPPPPRPVQVPAIKLDDLVAAMARLPRLIKIDVESAEESVLEGLASTLSRGETLLFLETGDFDLPGVASTAELIRRLGAFHYTPLEPCGDGFRDHEARPRYGAGNLLLVPEGLRSGLVAGEERLP